jgi:hypothetical protein
MQQLALRVEIVRQVASIGYVLVVQITAMTAQALAIVLRAHVALLRIVAQFILILAAVELHPHVLQVVLQATVII